MNELRVSLIQSDIVWENKEENLRNYHSIIASLAGKTDLAILPETCTTGFSMHVSQLAESVNGYTILLFKDWAKKYHLAICGSFIAKEESRFYNRAFFITPEGESFFYDKRHLFRMGDENKFFSPGNQLLTFSYKGWNIRMIICYDLRFPVWIRNQHNEYDLLICVANWPKARAAVWKTLLQARAIENCSYVCATNRIGKDGQGIDHQGNSVIINHRGETIGEAVDNQTTIITQTLDKEKLQLFRKKFPVWMDADNFVFS